MRRRTTHGEKEMKYEVVRGELKGRTRESRKRKYKENKKKKNNNPP